MTRSKDTPTHRRRFLLFAALLGALLTTNWIWAQEPSKGAQEPGKEGAGEVIEVALDAAVVDADATIPHQSPIRPSGTGWVKINGEKITNKRITIYLWKGTPRRRAAISGRADGEGAWRWRQRPRRLGYAPFDLERNDVIHLICTNGDRVDRCYRIQEVRTDGDGFVVYFKGREVPCG